MIYCETLHESLSYDIILSVRSFNIVITELDRADYFSQLDR